MSVIGIEINCVECGEPIVHEVNVFGDDPIPVINAFCFEQESFFCENCEHTTITAELEMMDEKDL